MLVKCLQHTSLSSVLFMFGTDANLRDRRSRAAFSRWWCSTHWTSCCTTTPKFGTALSPMWLSETRNNKTSYLM